MLKYIIQSGKLDTHELLLPNNVKISLWVRISEVLKKITFYTREGNLKFNNNNIM